MPTPELPPALSAELEAALLRELRAVYVSENQLRFGNQLRLPVLALSDTAARLGQWMRGPRVLELARGMVLARPWLEVVAVLQHEMAHQFVDEVLGVRAEGPHGTTFQQVCAERGIDARARGEIAVIDGGEGPADHVLRRIRKLLALAGSGNQHEAEAAMQRAHELMLRHNIDDVRARAVDAFEVRHLGDPGKRGNRVEADVIGVLTEFFFVEVIRVPVYLPASGRRGNVYEVIGTAANVEMACHVHDFLLATAERLWQANRADRRIRDGRDRRSYLAGVVRGFRDKLAAERTQLRGTGLVWRGDAALGRWYRARHPRITTRRRMVRIDGAHAAGREAGRTVVLHRPVTSGPSGGGPRLLGR